jgi:hypothetical protein
MGKADALTRAALKREAPDATSRWCLKLNFSRRREKSGNAAETYFVSATPWYGRPVASITASYLSPHFSPALAQSPIDQRRKHGVVADDGGALNAAPGDV